MAIVSNGPLTINRGVPTTIYNAPAGQLPGLFFGKVRPQSLVNASDTVLVELLGRTTGNVTDDVEVSKVMKFTDLSFYLTPLKATGKYEIRVTLENTSPSASIPLDYEIDREAAP
jgi:hypothetical protein